MDILKKICDQKKVEVEKLKQKTNKRKRLTPIRNFIDQIKIKDPYKFNIITEIKRASPSRGLICKDFEPEKIAKQYEIAGAKCISVLTEKNFFKGEIELLQKIKKSVSLPILRKDFIIDEWQIYESFYNEADCILLIIAALKENEFRKFYQVAKSLKLNVITEVHNEEELNIALNFDVECIGINNRNLKTLKIDLDIFNNLSPKIPKKIVRICESGISNKNEIKRFSKIGADAFLIGESLMKSKDIIFETKKLVKK